jgi:phosphogluconate dehydratase
MSGASGKVPAAIHMTPEALDGGPLARLREGDLVRLDANAGTLEALVSESEWNSRDAEYVSRDTYHHGLGRELFSGMRSLVGGAEEGASSFAGYGDLPGSGHDRDTH